jgi:predicted Rossmann-fold nucleotide-binding protein
LFLRGLNIKLPHEQKTNHYATLTLTFHHFFVRKVMLVKYTSAFIIMPGGLGTLDEMTEVLTLIQTQTIKPFPVLLFDRTYWQGFIDWLRNTCLKQGYINNDDLKLLRVCNTIEEITEAVENWHEGREIADGFIPIWMSPKGIHTFDDALAKGFAKRSAGKKPAGFEIAPLVNVMIHDDVA